MMYLLALLAVFISKCYGEDEETDWGWDGGSDTSDTGYGWYISYDWGDTDLCLPVGVCLENYNSNYDDYSYHFYWGADYVSHYASSEYSSSQYECQSDVPYESYYYNNGQCSDSESDSNKSSYSVVDTKPYVSCNNDCTSYVVIREYTISYDNPGVNITDPDHDYDYHYYYGNTESPDTVDTDWDTDYYYYLYGTPAPNTGDTDTVDTNYYYNYETPAPNTDTDTVDTEYYYYETPAPNSDTDTDTEHYYYYHETDAPETDTDGDTEDVYGWDYDWDWSDIDIDCDESVDYRDRIEATGCYPYLWPSDEYKSYSISCTSTSYTKKYYQDSDCGGDVVESTTYSNGCHEGKEYDAPYKIEILSCPEPDPDTITDTDSDTDTETDTDTEEEVSTSSVYLYSLIGIKLVLILQFIINL